MCAQPSRDGSIQTSYDEFYRRQDPTYVYPVEFVVRAYLGSYPRLPRREPGRFAGKRVLDLGCGDGRNIPFLANLGLTVYGVEISTEICARVAERMGRLGVPVELRVGRNAAMPFDDQFFDHVLACHSCHYVDRGTRFDDNAAEIARVMKPQAEWVFSVPMATSYILRDAIDQGDGHMEVKNDPYGIRNGYVLRKFDSASEIESTLAAWFTGFHIGACRNDFWGIDEHVWTVVCQRRSD
jgi:ubiquinone/menaquinone biosynthesis C-methylase UbiE